METHNLLLVVFTYCFVVVVAGISRQLADNLGLAEVVPPCSGFQLCSVAGETAGWLAVRRVRTADYSVNVKYEKDETYMHEISTP